MKRVVDPAKATLFVGAGISVDPPSSIPAATVLMDVLCRWIARGNRDLLSQLRRLRVSPGARKPYIGPYATLRFELLLDWLLYFRPEVVAALQSTQQQGAPNRWHWWVASVIRSGGRVVTTNFDTRIEEACRLSGVACDVAVISKVFPSPARLRRANLIKLHGTFRAKGPLRRVDAPMGTLRQIARWGLGYTGHATNQQALLRVLNSRPLIACGYSAWDSFDVIPLLEEVDPRIRVLWLEWAPDARLRMHHPRVSGDPLTLWRHDATPVDMFTSHRSRIGAVNSTWLVRSSGPAFISWLWPRVEEKRFMRRVVAPLANDVVDERAACGRTLMDELRKLDPLSRDESNIIVRSLTSAYGNERAVDEHLSPVRLAPMRGEKSLIRALDRGQIGTAAARFVREIERTESRDDPLPSAEDMIWILEKMFWHALQLGQHGTARSLIRRMKREAARRRVLWANVLVLYLDGNLQHSLRHRVRSRVDARRVTSACRQQLRKALQFAIRIPRMDIAADAARTLRRKGPCE